MRDYKGEPPPGGKRTEIASFTTGSKRRLRWAAANADPPLISQFAMTYHQTKPGGRECKKHLHAFIDAVRRAYPQVKYLWILEFQKRGTPHFHVWLTLSAETPDLHEYLAATWHRIAEPESEFHYWWHMREENFIPWDMGSGTYLCKYLSKAYQKKIPPGFTGIGRFWGASRGMVGIPDAIMAADLPEAVAFVRTLCRHQETTLRKTKSSRKYHHQARRSPCSQRLPNGAIVARQLLKNTGGA